MPLTFDMPFEKLKSYKGTNLKPADFDAQHLAARIKVEVMMGVGLMDTICPPSTQFATYNKIKEIAGGLSRLCP